MRRQRTFHRLGILATLAVLAGGCVVSPQPIPPTIDAERITIELVSTDPDGDDPDTAIVTGAAGAVDPGEALLRATNLDQLDADDEVVVAADGSFEVVLPAQPGHELRLRAYVDDLQSEPLYLTVPDESGAPGQPGWRLGDCLVVDAAEGEVSFDDVVIGNAAMESIDVANSCSDEVVISNISLRSELHEQGCEDSHADCLTDSTDDELCAAPQLTCQESCRDDYADCVAAGVDSGTCEEIRDRCLASCDTDRLACCDGLLRDCLDEGAGYLRGFSFTSGELPLSIPAGATRSLVVTFVPVAAGPAEDWLLIEVVGVDGEFGSLRWPVTLTGVGVESE